MRTCRHFVWLSLAAVLCLSAGFARAGEEPAPKEPPRKGEAAESGDQAADKKPAEEKKPAEYLGEYVWGPHISKADLEGKVLLCVGFEGAERTAAAIPTMALGQIKDTKNLQVVLVLLDKANISKALRMATATKISLPIVMDAKIAGLKVEKDDKGKPKQTMLIRRPDGRELYSGPPDPMKAPAAIDDVKKALAEFPSPLMGGRTYKKVGAAVKQLASATTYASIVASLKTKDKSKDPVERDEARALAYAIENYGNLLLAKAEYFESIHLPTAQDTYAAVAKAFKGLESGAKAEERLKAIKEDRATAVELAACKLADQIRQQAGLLAPAKGAEAVDLGNPECLKAPYNKAAVAKLMPNVAAFKKKYGDSRIAEECRALLETYGLKDDAK